MNEQDLKHIIEATLLAAGKPVTTQQLLDLFDERERPTAETMQTALGMLMADYENRGIELIEVASGWRIQVRPRAAEVVSRLWQERPAKYSRALLETLALIAYRQPITRSEIEEIRGVSISSTIMRTLQERNWIRTVGHREVPGRPELLGTTREFLDYFGLKSLDQLPTLAELKDVETIGVQLELATDQIQEGAAAAEGEEATGDAAAVAEGEIVANAAAEEQSETSEASAAEAETQSEEEVVAEADDDNANDDSSNDDTDEGDGNIDDGSDESELLADADNDDEDSDAPPIMVASSEDEQDHVRISEPPSDH
ncbi:MAG TPA: SMC-Scp complex subunit ScpB [Steroidobacter sp.]|uniref:SMC-Scp complex subunit ScpB n=1 Tax=Steroidobacter sp. TaxID=1978227 RepID=UPI002EDB38CC